MADSPWMTPAETCEYLRWLTADGAPDRNRLYHARSLHQMPGRRVAGRLLFHRDQIDRWALTGETGVRITKVAS
jgi:hypothetical protein